MPLPGKIWLPAYRFLVRRSCALPMKARRFQNRRTGAGGGHGKVPGLPLRQSPYILVTWINPLSDRLRAPCQAVLPGKEVNTMVALTDEMKETIARNRVVPMATASKDGIPNVVPMASIRVVGDDTIWIMNNYMVKTLRNLEENPIVALYFYDPKSRCCFQVKGTAEIQTSGPDYEKFRDRVKAESDRFPTRSLVVMKVTDVFECMPGKGAGKKVL